MARSLLIHLRFVGKDGDLAGLGIDLQDVVALVVGGEHLARPIEADAIAGADAVELDEH